MAAAHLRYDAEAARVITALRDLQVSTMRRREAEARRIVVWDVGRLRSDEVQLVTDRSCGNVERRSFSQNASSNRTEILHLIQPDKRVDLRQLFAQLLGETLRHAPAHDQLLAGLRVQSA